MSMGIRWTKKREVEVTCEMFVRVDAGPYVPAEPDDLRRACEASGLGQQLAEAVAQRDEARGKLDAVSARLAHHFSDGGVLVGSLPLAIDVLAQRVKDARALGMAEAGREFARERDTYLDALAEHVSPDGTVTTLRMVRPSSVLDGIRSLQSRLRDARSDYREHDAELEAAVENCDRATERLDKVLDEVRGLKVQLAAALDRIAELEAPLPEATVEELVVGA
jgi:hypothetical protein